MTMRRTGPDRDTAERLLAVAREEADRLGCTMALAVCDAGGHLVAFTRMDTAPLLAVETAPAKARTAVFLRRSTEATVAKAREHPEVYGSFMTAGASSLVLSMGGEPLWSGDDLVGGVAAAGGTGRQDILVARAAVRAWQALDRDAVAADAPVDLPSPDEPVEV